MYSYSGINLRSRINQLKKQEGADKIELNYPKIRLKRLRRIIINLFYIKHKERRNRVQRANVREHRLKRVQVGVHCNKLSGVHCNKLSGVNYNDLYGVHCNMLSGVYIKKFIWSAL